MRALMSVLAMYRYDDTLFDGLQVPAGLNKEGLVNELVMQLAELNTIISNPDIMKAAITEWSKTKSEIWQHLFDTTQYEYNPIWNKDGVYTETETRDLTDTSNGTQNRNLKTKTDAVVKNDKSAFNSSNYEPSERGTNDETSTDTGTLQVNSVNKDTGTITRIRNEHGNIGVTTTQQMIMEERQIADYSLYQVIIEDFKTRFCIMVY